MVKKPEDQIFSLKIRLGDILTMLLVSLQAAAVLGGLLVGYINVIDRISGLETRLSVVESKVDSNTKATNDAAKAVDRHH